MFRIILDQRKRREIDPTMDMLRLCLAELEKGGPSEVYARDRLREIYGFFADVDALYADVRQLPLSTLRGVVKTRGMVQKLLGRRSREPRKRGE